MDFVRRSAAYSLGVAATSASAIDGPDSEDHAQRRQRCYFLLSVKSSGSSVIQRKIAAISSARLVEHTRHEEMETLFFTKAASILGLPQFRMENSVVPYSASAARAEMRRLLAQICLDGSALATEADSSTVDAMVRLLRGSGREVAAPSYQPSVISLMESYAESTPEIDCRFVGLVRNPIAHHTRAGAGSGSPRTGGAALEPRLRHCSTLPNAGRKSCKWWRY